MGSKQKVAIIGAGPIGFTLLRVIQQSIKGKVLHLVCCEKQDDWSGMWNYTWRTGTDQYGDVIHNSMCRDLWTNFPKQYSEFPDYTFEEQKASGHTDPTLTCSDLFLRDSL